MNAAEIPYNHEAEEGLLGSALIDPTVLYQVDTTSDEFYIHRHGFIWEAAQSLAGRGIPVDFLTLTNELSSRGQLEEIGGPAAITGLINSVPTSMNAAAYAAIVREKSLRRNVIRRGNELIRAAYDESQDLDATTGPIFANLTKAFTPRGGAVHISHFTRQLYNEVEERRKNPSPVWGMATGLKDFDFVTGGLQPSEVLYLGGEPGVGKSLLGGQMALQMGLGFGDPRNAGKPFTEWLGRPGVIYSMEMKGVQFIRRLVSGLSDVGTERMKTGKINDEEWNEFKKAIKRLNQSQIYISDSPVWTLPGFRADAARLKETNGIEWFLLDYLYLMVSFVPGQYQDHEKASIVSRWIHSVAREFDLAGITINSMTKQGMGSKRPTQEQMMGGSGVIHDADVICFLTEWIDEDGEDGISLSEEEAENCRVLSFEKGRELAHPRGRINLVKRQGIPAFGDWADPRRMASPMSPYGANGNGRDPRRAVIHLGK